MDIPHSVYPLNRDGCVDRFHLQATVDDVALNIPIQIFVSTPVSNSLGSIPGAELLRHIGILCFT